MLASEVGGAEPAMNELCCRTVEMDGDDFRRVVKNAEIGR